MQLSAFVNEPIRDFTEAGNREAARAAVQALPASFGASHPAFVGGERLDTGIWIPSSSPARPELVLGRVAGCRREHVDQAFKAAREAFRTWSRTPPGERAQALQRLAGLLRRDRFDLLALLGYEIGKDWREAEAEIAEAIDFCDYYALLAMDHFRPAPLTPLARERNLYHQTPLGVGVVIAPWNFPLAILAGMVMAAVVAGNTVVVKPSSDTPIVAARFFALAEEAGIPAGVMNLTPGSGGEIGDYLVTHPDTRFVAFTGSAEVGLRISELIARPDPARRWITRYVSELGGKNAIVVDETADLEAASADIVSAAFGFQGQKCSACSRLVVDRRVKAPLLDLVVEKARRLAPGDPWSGPGPGIGPVANRSAQRSVLAAVERGRQEARLVLGGKVLEREGFYLEPTIFDGVPADGFLGQEEIFGPVLGVLEADTFEGALDIANGVRYGLTGSVYSRLPERLEQAQREFHVGNLYLNRGCTGARVGVHPFGGFNLSGTDSKAGGPDYLLNFTQGKTVSERVDPRKPAA